MFSPRFATRRSVITKWNYVSKRTLVNNISNNFIVSSGQPDIMIPNLSLPEFLTKYQNKYEKYVAMECAETKRKYTFGEIRDKSTTLSKGLRKILKLEEGDVVAIILRNVPEYPIANLGVMKANLIVTAVSPVFTPDEISRQLMDSGAKAIITEVTIHPQVKSALDITRKNLPTIVMKTQTNQSLPENTINFHEFVNADIDYPEIKPADPDSVVLMPYSSGTTGLPKGVKLTHQNIISNVLQTYDCDRDFQKTAVGDYQEILPNILPYYHIFGQAIIHGLNIVGGKIITVPTFTQDLFISALTQNQSTILYLVPPLVLLCTYHSAIKKEHLENVSAITSGGAPLAASDEKQFTNKFGDKIVFLQGYGMTETSCGATNLYPRIMENEESYKGSIGRPITRTLLKVVDPEDSRNTPLPPNTSGEIMIQGPQIMKGYHNLPEETKKTLTGDGWLKTGDIGYYNNDGFFFITDRLKELIKVKGNQVAPAELEGVIRSYPGVADAGVIGIPHETSGEVPRAYVVCDKEVDVNKLNAFVNEKVARYKQLKGGIEIVETIPKNPAGKILRKEIKEQYLKEKQNK